MYELGERVILGLETHYLLVTGDQGAVGGEGGCKHRWIMFAVHGTCAEQGKRTDGEDQAGVCARTQDIHGFDTEQLARVGMGLQLREVIDCDVHVR